jgi:hypothetical protein
MKTIFLVIALLSSTGQLIAQRPDSLRADSTYNKDGLMIIFTLIGDKGFFDQWAKPESPKIVSVDSFQLGQHVIPIIIFSTNAKDQKGNANLTYDIRIIRPDGEIYGHFENLTVWKDKPAPHMHLVEQPIDVGLEKTDPLGVYKIESVVYDNNKKVKVHFHLAFTVIH